MPDTQPPDKVQREISEILEKLDNFVPEERLATKIRNRSRQQRAATGPNAIQRAISRINLGYAMLAGLALILAGWLFNDTLGSMQLWVQLAGTVLLIGAFVISAVGGRRGRSASGSPRYQKRWRGQIIEYDDAQPNEGRGWWRRWRH